MLFFYLLMYQPTTLMPPLILHTDNSLDLQFLNHISDRLQFVKYDNPKQIRYSARPWRIKCIPEKHRDRFILLNQTYRGQRFGKCYILYDNTLTGQFIKYLKLGIPHFIDFLQTKNASDLIIFSSIHRIATEITQPNSNMNSGWKYFRDMQENVLNDPCVYYKTDPNMKLWIDKNLTHLKCKELNERAFKNILKQIKN